VRFFQDTREKLEKNWTIFLKVAIHFHSDHPKTNTVFSQLTPLAFISNLAWWTRRFFESAVYLSPPFFKKGLLFLFLAAVYLTLNS